ncbi:hypothetical protein BU15DRAFT_60052 [Melanogaster broomeanus]|nr:hypothetical protein BU15DRAFT_60052 [Melanogaster broomeanus]
MINDQPSGDIAEAFRQYINNEIPTRFIDTSTKKFVERKDVFDIFQHEIAKVTEEVIAARFKSHGWNPQNAYVSQRDEVLKEIIQEIVKYAVFSHRWDAAGEPLYQDVIARKQGSIAGFKKFTKFCKTAESLDYKLAWSDTCCIDRSNTAELSEAIHAMFKWYSHSDLCITHLAESSSYSDFDHEPWFTRGWTLQELLAPRRVKFYTKTWEPFTTHATTNDKDDKYLLSALSTVTGIPETAIAADNSKGIDDRSVWEIMSWASKRKTTRADDIAYCLIGLFRVNLTITYGDSEKAFPRLVEAIMMTKPMCQWDVFAWVGQASPDYPAFPSHPRCYAQFDKRMLGDAVGINDFAMTNRGLRLSSLPLIPMAFDSVSEVGERKYDVILKPRLNGDHRWVGTCSNVTVNCGTRRLTEIQKAEDLSLCILNHQLVKGGKRGKLEVGRVYVCFLLHSENQDGGESTWMKFTTDNSLRVSCMGKPEMSREGTGDISSQQAAEIEAGVFSLPLETTYIRFPARVR